MYKVTFHFEDGSPSVTYDIAPGESVLDIAMDNDINLHHNCGGVCACSTCHIYLQKGMDHVQEISDKEEDFIDRANNPRLNSRLSCQCVMINGDIEVTVPDQSDFHGH